MPETGMRRKYTAAKVIADVGRSRFGIDTVLGQQLPPPGERAVLATEISNVTRRRSTPAGAQVVGQVVGEPVQLPVVYNPVALRHATAMAERAILNENGGPGVGVIPSEPAYVMRPRVGRLAASRSPRERAVRIQAISGVVPSPGLAATGISLGGLGQQKWWEKLLEPSIDLTKFLVGQRTGSFQTTSTQINPLTGQPIVTTTSGRQPSQFGLPLSVGQTQVDAGLGGGMVIIGGAALLLLLVMMGGKRR